ncbi:signal recognition particle 14kD protein-domain-containing protein [Apodospora peruviana]|uniref:Signal recognition particle subunit SRP14 n=1 Tax=Apodospora peruviana TaxID=516989 RepID=A0AAE0ID55_9PEZI|nr:signal recognition particle 14kD protein-domain-containing protein [Apodospora peruviana]
MQPEEFLTKLAELLSTRKTGEHVYLSQKRLTGQNEVPKATEENPFPDLTQSATTPKPIIIRATDGKRKKHITSGGEKIKLSTEVSPDQLEGFYTRYAEVCKANMTTLKPRDRKKGKAKARKKKGGAGQTSMTAIP